jgi:hypothetical protein
MVRVSPPSLLYPADDVANRIERNGLLCSYPSGQSDMILCTTFVFFPRSSIRRCNYLSMLMLFICFTTYCENNETNGNYGMKPEYGRGRMWVRSVTVRLGVNRCSHLANICPFSPIQRFVRRSSDFRFHRGSRLSEGAFYLSAGLLMTVISFSSSIVYALPHPFNRH